MTDENTEQKNPSRELAIAYEEVFGRADKRNRFQQRVLDDLWASCGMKRTTVMMAGMAIDVNQTLVTEGRRQIALHIQQRLDAAASSPEDNKLTVKKR